MYNLLSKVDVSKELQQLTKLLENASNELDNSLENIVNAIGDIFQAGEYVKVGDRDALYTRIKDIEDILPSR